MPKEKIPSVRVSPDARLKAKQTVVEARKRRQSTRLTLHGDTANRLARLASVVDEVKSSAARAQRNLGPALRTAMKASATSLHEDGKLVAPVSAIDAGDRPLRLIVETRSRMSGKKLLSLATDTLGLKKEKKAVTIRPLFAKSKKLAKSLQNYQVIEFSANRRSTKLLRPRIADALRRTGAFASVRSEGLRMGLYSGTGSGTGPGYDMAEPDDRDWYLTSPDPNSADWRGYSGAIDVYGAWAALNANANGDNAGETFVIGHPDTGFRIHRDYPADSIDLVNAYNAFMDTVTVAPLDLETQNFARHGLTPTGFPYFEKHGTFTASVMVAPKSGRGTLPVREIVGVAPGATVLPLRCVNTVILAGDIEVTTAVEHAIDTDVDVISISLGGAPNPALRDALSAAVDQGIIVVAAAGQSEGFPTSQYVAAPACYPEVIAVGGSIGPLPWQGAFHGPEIDICAPAVNIRHATFEANGDDDWATSRGTSFATAIVAGLATLWLQAHGGRQGIEAAVPGVPVQQVFRHVLKQTAVDSTIFADDPPPGGWPTSLFGAGLVNAKALVRHPLPAPDDVPPIDANPPFNPYGAASGLAVVDLGEPWSLAVVNSLFTGFAATLGTFQSGAEMVGDMWSDFWEGPVTGVASTVSGWVASVGAASGLASSAVRAGAAAQAWEDALAAAGSVGGELGELLEETAATAEEAWEEAEDAVDEALDEAGDAVENFVEETGNLIEDTADSASETAGEVVGAVTGALGGIFGS